MQLEQPLTLPFQVLIIAAHPDDIEFGAAGSAAVWSEAGAEITYCIVTDGAAGSNEREVIYEHLVQRRRDEQLRAAEIVGVKDVCFLDYADGTLQPTLDLRRDLTRLIRQLRPNRVVFMDPTVMLVMNDGFDYINHPDHRAASEAALYAVFPSAETRPIFPELLEEGLEPHHVDELYLMMSVHPNIAVDVSRVWERKIQALLSHQSQLDESVVEMVRGWDRQAGEAVGVEYAESFRVMRFINATPSGKDSPAE
jgi:LmbE family N-acetylglucosaminyl deacetylase